MFYKLDTAQIHKVSPMQMRVAAKIPKCMLDCVVFGIFFVKQKTKLGHVQALN